MSPCGTSCEVLSTNPGLLALGLSTESSMVPNGKECCGLADVSVYMCSKQYAVVEHVCDIREELFYCSEQRVFAAYVAVPGHEHQMLSFIPPMPANACITGDD